jgi:hypothetical protein
MPTQFQKRLLSVPEARAFIEAATGRKISDRWLYALVKQGKLPGIRFDKVVIDEADLVAFLEQLPRVQPVAAPAAHPPAPKLQQPAQPASTAPTPAPAARRRPRAGARA